MSVTKVISGGQCGADIAGLRAAKALGLETTGWIPFGFRTKLGPRPEYAVLYNLRQTPVDDYRSRTMLNVMQADATVRYAWDWNSAGERVTLKYIRRYTKPYFDVDISRGAEYASLYISPAPHLLAAWLAEHGVRTLNVAGNSSPFIEEIVEAHLSEALTLVQERTPEMWPPYEC